MGDITKNFSFSEFDSKDGAKMPVAVKQNIRKLAKNLQVIRDTVGKAVHINSAYRSPEHNKKIGGVPNSQHVLGNAADIRIDGMTPKEVGTLLEKLIKEKKISEGGIGVYPTHGFTHYDIRFKKARWVG